MKEGTLTQIDNPRSPDQPIGERNENVYKILPPLGNTDCGFEHFVRCLII